jgi:AbrB family looped-hinge helix DNA binding protein
MDDILVKVCEGGRVVIPAEFRKAMGIEIGDELILHMEHGKIELFTRKQAIQYVQEEFANYVKDGRQLADELITERRNEAKHG